MDKDLLKKQSKIHGKGIFTNKKISKGEKFYIIPLDKIYKKPKIRCARIKENQYVYDNIILNFVNHSCSPNTKICFMGKTGFRALKNIKKGEEITLNYEKTELKKNKIKCKCNSDKCKGEFYKGE